MTFNVSLDAHSLPFLYYVMCILHLWNSICIYTFFCPLACTMCMSPSLKERRVDFLLSLLQTSNVLSNVLEELELSGSGIDPCEVTYSNIGMLVQLLSCG